MRSLGRIGSLIKTPGSSKRTLSQFRGDSMGLPLRTKKSLRGYLKSMTTLSSQTGWMYLPSRLWAEHMSFMQSKAMQVQPKYQRVWALISWQSQRCHVHAGHVGNWKVEFVLSSTYAKRRYCVFVAIRKEDASPWTKMRKKYSELWKRDSVQSFPLKK